MLGHVPRKVGRQSLEVAFRSMGYRTKGETFELHGYRQLRGHRRFHAKGATVGADLVPKAAAIDLHIDRMSDDLLGRHRDEVGGQGIPDEMDPVMRTLHAASPDGTARNACP